MLSNSKFFVTIAMRASKTGGMLGLLNLLLVVAFVQHVNGLAQLQQKQQQSEHEHFERAIKDGIANQYNNYNNNNNIKFNDDIRKHTLTSTTPLARLHKFNDKEIDLDAYVNEFNMQDEAAIPEDILDQKHIDDKENDELDQTADLNSDMTMGSTSLRANFEGKHFKEINENQRQKYVKNPAVENVRSIGPMTFMASSSSSKSNSNSNIQHKQIHEEMWHVADKERNLSNNNNNYNKPIKVDNNNNYMNLYNKNKKIGIKEMQLERTAIGDIENVACNEDESLANTNSNMKSFNSKHTQNVEIDDDDEDDDDDEEDAEELSESVIDRDKSVHNIRTGQTFAKQDNAAIVQTHTGWSVAEREQAAKVSKIANGQSTLQMPANVNRSRKQRRNLPEMKFGHRRDALDLYGSHADEDVDDASVGVGVGNADSNEYTIKTANALSSPAIAGTPEEINDYKNDYLNIFSIRSNTSTSNVRLPLGQVQNKVLNGTLADRVAIEETNKATDDANPSSIVSSSTFEQYKSKQRNNGHTGHKTHKKKYKDYLRYAWSILQTTPTETVTERATIISNKYNDNNNNNMQVDGFDKINATIKAQSTSRQRERAQKLQTEKSRGFPVPPIFTITSNPEGNMAVLKRHNSTTNRPFYEGQINYYLETKDDNDENVEQQAYVNDSKSVGGTGSGSGTDWYRRNSPMLRNGLRRTEINNNNNNINHMHQNAHNPRQQHYQHKFHEHPASNRYHHKHQQMPHQHTHHFSHALHQRHHHHHHQQQQQLHQHNSHHHQHRHNDQSQRQTAYPAGSSVLGHQITDAEDFERYYAKWPHLARVQFQVYDEHLREANEQQQQEKTSQEDEYPEYEYGSVAEMEEAQKIKPDEENLPPYVRKYNRRNKQLLDLLEGPLPPPKGYHWSGSKLQPGPVESSDNAQVIRLDDDYMREKRRRHQLLNGSKNNQLNDNFFAQQRQNDTTTSSTTNITELNMNNNHLPDEQQQQPGEMEIASELKTHVNKLIGNEPQMTWQIEKLLMPTQTTTTTTHTPKALVFRLPSFNSNQVGHAALRQRSRSAYTAGSTGQRRYMSGLLDSMELHETESSSNNNNVPATRLEQQQQTTTTTLAYPNTNFSYASTVKPLAIGTKMPTMPPRSISAFVYHRVVDNSPRQVGAGGTLQGRKQQLPFVAITDRRLETFKKSLLERQKEFEQNNFPPLP